MKKLLFLLCATTCMLAAAVFCEVRATDAATATTEAEQGLREAAKGMRKPIVLESTVSPLLNVTFNHRTHMSVPCQTCHHAEGSAGKFTPCRECHDQPGPRNQDVDSQFQAFHAKNSDRSCYGCHTKMAEANPKAFPHFTNCRPCHMSDAARDKARAEARGR